MKVVVLTYERGCEIGDRLCEVFVTREGAASGFAAALRTEEGDVHWIPRFAQQVLNTGEFNDGRWCVREVELLP